MKVVSFNANSIRVRLHQLEALIKTHDPDIIGIQETKVTDEEFPEQEINALGYQSVFHGQKTHYGVALLSKVAASNVQKGFAGDDDSSQRRFISGSFTMKNGQQLTVINGYFPQGESNAHESKYPAKKRFYADLKQLLENDYDPAQPLIVMGDMNIAHTDKDIGIGESNRKRWLRDGKCCFLPEERLWMESLNQWGLVDTFRLINPDEDALFSWFDYRSKGFEKDPRRGLRIDFILATTPLAEACMASDIDYAVRAMERPSDHCPIWSQFDSELA